MNPAFVTLFDSSGDNILSDAVDDNQTGWKKRTLSVNSIQNNRYVVQFFKRNANVSYTGNEFPSKYIKCKNYTATVATENSEP